MDNSVGINDVIVTKDQQTLRVQSIRRDGNEVRFIEGIDDTAASPMRITVLANNFLRILRKSPWTMDAKTGKKMDSRTGQPYVEHKEGATK